MTLGRMRKPGLKYDDEAIATATSFLMTFALALFFMLAITAAIKDNGLEQAKELSRYEYELVAGDIAASVEDMLHSAERNPEIMIEREIPLHHNVKTIEYIINLTDSRVQLKSRVEGITVTKPIHNNGNIQLRGDIQSSSEIPILVYLPAERAIVLRNFR